MQTDCNSDRLSFESFDGRRIVAAFDGGAITSNAGALLLRHTDKAIDLFDRVAACFSDRRDRGQVIGRKVKSCLVVMGDAPMSQNMAHRALISLIWCKKEKPRFGEPSSRDVRFPAN